MTLMIDAVFKIYLMFILTVTDLVITDNDTTDTYQSGLNEKFIDSQQLQLKTYNLDLSQYSKNSSANNRQSYSTHNTGKNRRPNIILILTDDQDIELGSLNFMKETTQLLKNSGAEFRHAYTTTPMCCPSRSSMLTGLYVHNHNVYTNNDNCSNIQWQIEHESKSFASYLSSAGYHTGYFGKYLNKYNGTYTPPGWKEWGGLIMNSKYYNYSINLNGRKIRHGDDYYKDYYSDLVTNDSINFLRQWKSENSHKPALLVMSFPAPHGPEDSAPQYSDMFFNVTTHHTPSYDYAPNPDKQWILQVTGPMMPIHKKFTNMLMTKRLQTLQSVDNGVKKIYDILKEVGELSNSYIIYTSDHGYHLGQFGLVKGKSFPFEFDVRVPFLVRGPGIEAGSIINEIALNIDLAPTILDMAGLQVPDHMDGRSLLRLLRKHKKHYKKYPLWPDTFLIESSGRRESISTEVYIKKNGTDNKNMTGIGGNMINSELLNTSELKNKTERILYDCKKPEFASPCKIGQKWHCSVHGNRWRKHKCRFHVIKERKQHANIEKCSCINEEGFIYVKFQLADKSGSNNWKMSELHPAVYVNYLKSNKTSSELVDELAEVWRLMKRYRRDIDPSKTLNSQISNIMEVIDGQMIELLAFQNRMNKTACVISSEGIHCSQEIYDDPTIWKNSQRNILKRIKLLKNQLAKLKKIQRHLFRNQPNLLEENVLFNGMEDLNDINRTLIRNSSDLSNNTKNNSNNAVKIDNKSNEAKISFPNRKHRHQNTNFRSTTILSKNSYKKYKWNSKIIKSIPDTCYCAPYSLKESTSIHKNNVYDEQKRQTIIQKLKRKERKFKKKAKKKKGCFVEKMNCFSHDNNHWKTPPYWTDGPFCFCMNAHNNTYNCLRTINSTHNFLYCEFITGLKTFFNLRIDPFQQLNRYNFLNIEEKLWLKSTLFEMIQCKGMRKCSFNGGSKIFPTLEEYQNSKINSDSDHKTWRSQNPH